MTELLLKKIDSKVMNDVLKSIHYDIDKDFRFIPNLKLRKLF
jgi:hypothetical protein